VDNNTIAPFQINKELLLIVNQSLPNWIKHSLKYLLKESHLLLV